MFFFSIFSMLLIAESLLVHLWETWTKTKDALSVRNATTGSAHEEDEDDESGYHTDLAKEYCHCRTWRKEHSMLMSAFSKRRKLARTIKVSAADLKNLQGIYKTSLGCIRKSRYSTKGSDTCDVDVGIKRSDIDDFVKTTGQQRSRELVTGAEEHLNKEIRNPKAEAYDSDDVQRKTAKNSFPLLSEDRSGRAKQSTNVTEPCLSSRGFLTDKEIAATIPFQPKGPRSLIPFRCFVDDDLDYDMDALEGEGWNSEEMFGVNEIKFGYRSTYGEDLTEYTPILNVENTKTFRQRWLRACLLADEIKASKYRGEQLESKKKRKKSSHK